MEYARFTEGSNSIDYLEKAVSFIKSAENKPEDWKWVILSAHGALYGFMICTLQGTNPDNVSTGKKQRLIDFNDALKRCQDPAWMNLGRVHQSSAAIAESEASFASTPLRVSQPICALQAHLMVNPARWNAGNPNAGV